MRPTKESIWKGRNAKNTKIEELRFGRGNTTPKSGKQKGGRRMERTEGRNVELIRNW